MYRVPIQFVKGIAPNTTKRPSCRCLRGTSGLLMIAASAPEIPILRDCPQPRRRPSSRTDVERVTRFALIVPKL